MTQAEWRLEMLADKLEWLRLHTAAGEIIASFSPASAPHDVTQRELDDVRALHDRCDVIMARIWDRWLHAPVDPEEPQH